jgi:hypothetical protein
MAFESQPVQLAGVLLPWWAAVLELAVFAAVTPYVSGIIATRILGAKLASFVGLSEVLFAVLFAWVLLGELPRAIQVLGGLFILAGVVAVRAEEPHDLHVDGLEPPSAAEPGLPLVEAPGGDGPVVADDRVHLEGVDVVPAQHHGGGVRAVQEHGPV